MSYLETVTTTSPEIIHHPLLPGEREQAERIFRRNALLADLYPEDRRTAYAAMAGQTPLADGVSIEPVSHAHTRGWWVRPVAPQHDKAIFFVHGGGYHLGDAKSYLGFASQIAVLTNCAVFSVDYALAPEHRFPAAYNDVLRARRWFVSQGFAQYSAMGDSAGGGVVLATAEGIENGATLASVVVFSPWTDLANSGPSFRDPSTRDPVFLPAVIEGLASSYLGGKSALDPKASPLYGIVEGRAPVNVQVGSNELLLDDSVRYAQLAASKGVEVRLDIFDGMYHVFQRDVGTLKTSRTALEISTQFVAEKWDD